MQRLAGRLEHPPAVVVVAGPNEATPLRQIAQIQAHHLGGLVGVGGRRRHPVGGAEIGEVVPQPPVLDLGGVGVTAVGEVGGGGVQLPHLGGLRAGQAPLGDDPLHLEVGPFPPRQHPPNRFLVLFALSHAPNTTDGV